MKKRVGVANVVVVGFELAANCRPGCSGGRTVVNTRQSFIQKEAPPLVIWFTYILNLETVCCGLTPTRRGVFQVLFLWLLIP